MDPGDECDLLDHGANPTLSIGSLDNGVAPTPASSPSGRVPNLSTDGDRRGVVGVGATGDLVRVEFVEQQRADRLAHQGADSLSLHVARQLLQERRSSMPARSLMVVSRWRSATAARSGCRPLKATSRGSWSVPVG